MGFEIDDRFISATPNAGFLVPGIQVAPDNHTLNIVWYDVLAQQFTGAYYWLAVY
jgi:hypothetical protein